eukprot:241797_1
MQRARQNLELQVKQLPASVSEVGSRKVSTEAERNKLVSDARRLVKNLNDLTKINGKFTDLDRNRYLAQLQKVIKRDLSLNVAGVERTGQDLGSRYSRAVQLVGYIGLMRSDSGEITDADRDDFLDRLRTVIKQVLTTQVNSMAQKLLSSTHTSTSAEIMSAKSRLKQLQVESAKTQGLISSQNAQPLISKLDNAIRRKGSGSGSYLVLY